ncbi:hypothetical protein M0813_18953 [Anaeramoeba flamelloides]|uniref:Uncharacterized protein n=1 Tax=Anaeramoeba flamelloides TaxID=1746091 RepID=A0ABQ8YSN0_9EUKA|nr:hypothetical protein M0813_18953 [Anaeramoeba flamelloides]
MTVVFSVGYNYYGQLGLNHFNNTIKPQPIGQYLTTSLKSNKFLKDPQFRVSAGDFHSVIYTNKIIFLFGSSSQYEIGEQKSSSTNIPTELPTENFLDANDSISQIVCGSRSTLILSQGGLLFHMGAIGGPGTQDWLTFNREPSKINTFSKNKILMISAGGWHYLALDKLGRVYSWGQLSKNEYWKVPKKIKSLKDIHIINISCGRQHSACVSNEGKIYVWGCTTRNRLLVDISDVPEENPYVETPRQIKSSIFFTHVSCGLFSTYATDNNNNLYSGGLESSLGRENNNDNDQLVILEKVKEIGEGVIKVSTGSFSCSFLTEEGNVYSFGLNNSGQLGVGDTIKHIFPQKVTMDGFMIFDIACGASHTLLVGMKDDDDDDDDDDEIINND